MSALTRTPFLVSILVLAAVQGKKTVAPAAILAAAPKALETITAADLKAHVKVLASRELGGRLTGTAGQIKAAEMFAEHFEKLGLKPLGDRVKGKRSFFQRYPVKLSGLEDKSTGLYGPDGQRIHDSGAWFLPRSKKKKIEVKGRLVFAGSDMGDVDLGRSIAVVPFDTSARGGGIYQAMGDGFRLMAKVRGLARKAHDAGARACVLVSKQFSNAFLSAANMSLVYPGKPLVTRKGRRGMRFGSTRPKIPTLAVCGKDAERILGELGLTLNGAVQEEDDLAIGKRTKKAYKIGAKAFETQTDALNVCAVLKGRDSKLASQAIIYSCHMDHLGLAADGGAFYGADDNASGSSTVFEIAEAYAKLTGNDRPKRSVIFLAVSGEELGLWGSEHFANHPTWPLAKIVADVNMDMLGRSTNKVPADTVALTPTYRHRSYSTLARDAERIGEAFGLKMGNGDRFYARSDHYNFARKGIPVVFFCDDEHPDYHMPTDTWDKLDFDKIEKIARLAFMVGYRTANARKRPRVLGRQEDW